MDVVKLGMIAPTCARPMCNVVQTERSGAVMKIARSQHVPKNYVLQDVKRGLTDVIRASATQTEKKRARVNIVSNFRIQNAWIANSLDRIIIVIPRKFGLLKNVSGVA